MFGERDSRFHQLFEEAAASVLNGAKVLEAIVVDPGVKEKNIIELEEIEHKGDSLTHDIIAELNKAFITPIDREDIFLLAKELDNVIDMIEATGHRFIMFNISKTEAAAQTLAGMITTAGNELIAIMQVLRKPKNIVADNRQVIEINRIEDDGDKVYRRAVKELYSGKYETMEVIKWREIYDHLEDTLDAMEDVANIVEGIAMKHS